MLPQEGSIGYGGKDTSSLADCARGKVDLFQLLLKCTSSNKHALLFVFWVAENIQRKRVTRNAIQTPWQQGQFRGTEFLNSHSEVYLLIVIQQMFFG